MKKGEGNFTISVDNEMSPIRDRTYKSNGSFIEPKTTSSNYKLKRIPTTDQTKTNILLLLIHNSSNSS